MAQSVSLCPYLNFDGTCGEAMKFYQSVLGGKLTMQTYKEAGQSGRPEDDHRIMHAVLTTPVLTFMGSDGNREHPVTMGNSIHMSLMGEDEALLTEYFNGLSRGGKVDFGLTKQFWGDTFGMFTDKFGIHWMVNISSQKKKKG